MSSEKTINYCDDNLENCIKEFIDKSFEEKKLLDEFQNSILREDVLKLLDKFCTVIYYPLPQEKNNGFHINDVPCCGQINNFVFINTAQTIEKQIFTAAHELGHIWDVYECVKKTYPGNDLPSSEVITNRFAAILLMPKDAFKVRYQACVEKYVKDDRITVLDMYKVIVSLMDYFFVPRKSVILRMVELGLISYDNTASILLGENSISENILETVTSRLLQDYGCDAFIRPTNKKWIEGLSALLDEAEKLSTLPTAKIDSLRKQFNLGKADIPQQMSNTMNISITEETSNDSE